MITSRELHAKSKNGRTVCVFSAQTLEKMKTQARVWVAGNDMRESLQFVLVTTNEVGVDITRPKYSIGLLGTQQQNADYYASR